MAATTTRQATESIVRPQPRETEAVAALSNRLDEMVAQRASAQLVGPDGATLTLPDSVFRALKLVAQSMARGQSVALVPHGEELTTQQAADILHVSRPHLVKLLEEGAIPHHKVGSHRRLLTDDILIYRERRANDRAAKLDEMARISQEIEGDYH